MPTDHRDDTPTPGTPPLEQLRRHARGRAPKVPYRNELSPFARVLVDYTLDQRPNLTVPQLANRLGISRQTVAQWIYKGSEPELQVMLNILAVLGIPFRKLAIAYREENVPLPSDLIELAEHAPIAEANAGQGTEAPRAKRYTPPQQRPQDDWEAMLHATVESLRAAGMSDEAIDEIVTLIRQKQTGRATLAPNIAREHAASASDPGSSVPETRPLKNRPTPDPQRSPRE